MDNLCKEDTEPSDMTLNASGRSGWVSQALNRLLDVNASQNAQK